MKKKRIIIIFVAVFLMVSLIASVILGIFMSGDKFNKEDDGIAFDELYVRDVLENKTADDIINDPQWEENLADSTEDYIMVSADKFDLTKEMGVGGGYSMLHFDAKTKDIEMIQHSYVTHTEEKEPKAVIEELVANIQTNITGLLGNPQRKFMLMNSSGEFKDYDGLSVEEMIDSILENDTVMYAMFECNGIRYELNIMYSDETVYTMVWIYEESVARNSPDNIFEEGEP